VVSNRRNDVAGAFHNSEPPLSAELVCAWTWFCTGGVIDVHPNIVGCAVITQAFLDIVDTMTMTELGPPPIGIEIAAGGTHVHSHWR
jgi:hypothetical protein